ncbi:MAG TPA: class I SAM-dependent methyltransferase [Chthonomonadaceae bacterium]|nr:class I SAM-dependent methyltransferase [Chthonomonadaceae bacterium]
MTDYLYPNEHVVALARLQALEQIEDACTLEQLITLGVGAGWNCLEIGAGAGSIAYWLADQVGKEGRVVATDVQPHLLDSERCEVWRHDIVEDALPPQTFDLAHMRHVLIHVPQEQHERIFSKVLSTLKPGGVLLVEESDFSTWQVDAGTPEPLRSTCEQGIQDVLWVYAERGMDVRLGQHLGALAKRVGFQVTRMTRRARTVVGGSAEARFHQISFQQLAASLTQTHPPVAAKVARLGECLEDPRLSYRTRTTIAVSAERA